MSTRVGEIKNWLLSLQTNIDLDSLQYIQADASDRKYLRAISPDQSYIIMDTKPGLELDNFIHVANLLAQHKLNAPKILASDLPNGLLLLNDLGNQTYLSKLKNSDQSTRDTLYMDAILALHKLQAIKTTRPVMDANYIADRLNVFRHWYLQKHLGLDLDSELEQTLLKMQNLFTGVFTAQTQVFVHLDYHSRNLMWQANANPGILDFQDAMLGPVGYDLVSLLQDAYYALPRSELESWVGTFNDLGNDLSLRAFDLIGLQRHIKNLGVFARLHHRDNKSHYLHDMPMLFDYIKSTCSRYADLDWLADFFTELAVQELPSQNV